jgi:AbrB family looped-hinge helix DNA binding protein
MPPEVRQRLGLKGGDRVEFAVENGRVVVRRENALERTNESRESHRQALSKAK